MELGEKSDYKNKETRKGNVKGERMIVGYRKSR